MLIVSSGDLSSLHLDHLDSGLYVCKSCQLSTLCS